MSGPGVIMAIVVVTRKRASRPKSIGMGLMFYMGANLGKLFLARMERLVGDVPGEHAFQRGGDTGRAGPGGPPSTDRSMWTCVLSSLILLCFARSRAA